MNTQLDLPDLTPPAPSTGVEDILQILATDGGWLSATALCFRLGYPATEDGKREIRKLAAKSLWIISGQQGYRHLRHATDDEYRRFIAEMAAIMRALARRISAIRKNKHAIIG